MRVKNLLPLLGILVMTAVAKAENNSSDPDRIFTPREAFVAAANKGLGGAGCAMPWGLESVFANPALLYSCRNGNAPTSRSVTAGFGRDSLFDRSIVPAGMGWFRRRDAAAVHFRALSSGFGLDDYEVSAALCRRISGSASAIGPVDMGITVRYEYADWKKRRLDTLATIFSFVLPGGGKTRPDSMVKNGIPPEGGRFRENRLIFDLGFFQPEITYNIDCGVMVKNLTGFFYRSENPDTLVESGRVGTLQDSIAIMRTSRSYADQYKQSAGMVAGKYSTLCIGLNYRLPSPVGNVALAIPFDAELYGLFDPKMKNALAIRCGVQAHIAKNFFVRIGYSHAPELFPADFRVVPLVNNMSFGASLLPPGIPAVIDCYFSKFDWGMNVGVDY